jgi:hypothetical protein
VVSRQNPTLLHFGSGDLLQHMIEAFSRLHVAANHEDDTRIV